MSTREFPLHDTDEKVMQWLVSEIKIAVTSTSLYGRATVQKIHSEQIRQRLEKLLGQCGFQVIPRSTVCISISLNARALDSLEEQTKNATLYGTLFRESIILARDKFRVLREEIKAEHKRLCGLKATEGGEPRCDECGNTKDLEFQRPVEQRGGNKCISTLLLSRKRWAEAETLSRSCRLLCETCNGRTNRKRQAVQSK